MYLYVCVCLLFCASVHVCVLCVACVYLRRRGWSCCHRQGLCACMRACVRVCVCVCVRMRVRARVCACMYVCRCDLVRRGLCMLKCAYLCLFRNINFGNVYKKISREILQLCEGKMNLFPEGTPI